MFLGRPARLLQRPHHGVERIGDADDEGLGRVLGDAGAGLGHDLEIDADEIVAAHAGLARHAGGDDDHVGALDRLIGLGAGDPGVEALDRRGLGEIERLALRDAFGDVEQDHVAEVLEAGEQRERAADLTGADQCNLLARHGDVLRVGSRPRKSRGDVISPLGPAVQVANWVDAHALGVVVQFEIQAENHAHMMAIYFMHYNFVRIHQTLKITPAMAAGVTDKLWEMSDMVKVLEDWENTT